jgi:hypothetical protein
MIGARVKGTFVFVATIVALWCAGAHGQTSATPADGASLLSARVPTIIIHNGTLLEGLAQLSVQPVELSLSFEEILKPKASSPPAAEIRFDLDLRNRTISEILDALCSRDRRYAWKLDGFTINVYPQATEGDVAYLMNRHIPRLELKDVKDAGEAMFVVVEQLPRPFEQIAFAQAGGDTSYSSPWTATLADLTVRQAFNLLARHLGSKGGWVFSGSNEFRTIGFHNRQIHYSSQ